jgi:hypothetical protein
MDPNDLIELLIRHQMTPEYQRQQESDALLAEMLCAGMSPDDAKRLLE